MREGGALRGALVRGLAVIALAGALVFTFGLAAWLTLRVSIRFVEEITVPAVVGLDRADAESRLKADGLRPEIGGQRPDATRPPGRVLDQYPAAGARTKPGRPVRLVISSGAEHAVAPDLVGSSLRTAQIALRRAGLKLGSNALAPHPRIAAGKIVSQDPPATGEGFPGESVAVLVSAGPRPRALVMPELTGRRLATVQRAFRRLGFTSIDVPGGDGLPEPSAIASQDPPRGSRIVPETRIVLRPARPSAVPEAESIPEPEAHPLPGPPPPLPAGRPPRSIP